MIVSIFNEGEEPARYSFLQDHVVIGRNPGKQHCVEIDSKTISRSHLKAQIMAGHVQIMDLNSSNGTTVNGEQLTADKWCIVGKQDKIRLAEHAGFLTIQIRCQELPGKTIQALPASNTRQGTVSKGNDCSSEESSEENRSRSRDQKGIALSKSTLGMLKEMTLNRKSKQERVKFLKLMGYPQAQFHWSQIESQLQKRKPPRLSTQKAEQQLEKQFSQGRTTSQKKGLGMH